jgi:hypothetical protein
MSTCTEDVVIRFPQPDNRKSKFGSSRSSLDLSILKISGYGDEVRILIFDDLFGNHYD